MKLKMLLPVIVGVLLGCVPVLAQTTTITATKIQSDMSGDLLASGFMCLTPVNANGQPAGFTAPGGGQVLPNQNCYPVTSGAIGSVVVADTTLSFPAGVGYAVQIQNAAHIPIYNLPQTIFPTGTTWSLDTWSPTVSIPVTSTALAYSANAPQGRCGTAPAITYTASAYYSCVGQIWVQIATTGASFAPGGDLSGSPTNQMVVGLNGHSLAALGAGVLKQNASGVPAIAVAGTDYLTPGSGSLTSGNTGTATISGTWPNQVITVPAGSVSFTPAGDLGGSSSSQTVVGIGGVGLPGLGSGVLQLTGGVPSLASTTPAAAYQGATIATTLVSDYGSTNTDNAPMIQSYINACAAGVTNHLLIPAGNYDMKTSATGTSACPFFWIELAPGATINADPTGWTSGTGTGMLNFNDANIKISGQGVLNANGVAECVQVKSTTAGYATSAAFEDVACNGSSGQGFDVLSSIFNLPRMLIQAVTFKNVTTNNSYFAGISVRDAYNVVEIGNHVNTPCTGSTVAPAGCGGFDYQAINGFLVEGNFINGMPFVLPAGNPNGQFHFLESQNGSFINNTTEGGTAPPLTPPSPAGDAGAYFDTDWKIFTSGNHFNKGGVGERFEVSQDMKSEGDTSIDSGSSGFVMNARDGSRTQLVGNDGTSMTAASNVTQTVDTSDFPTAATNGLQANCTGTATSSGSTITLSAGCGWDALPSGSVFYFGNGIYTTTATGTHTSVTVSPAPGTVTSLLSTSTPYWQSIVETVGTGFASGSPLVAINVGSGGLGSGLNWPITPVTRFYMKESTALTYPTLFLNYYAGSTLLASEALPTNSVGTWQTVSTMTEDWAFKFRGTNVLTSLTITAGPPTGGIAVNSTGSFYIKIADVEQGVPNQNDWFINANSTRSASNGGFAWGPMLSSGFKGGHMSDYGYRTSSNANGCTAACLGNVTSGILIQPSYAGVGAETMRDITVDGVTLSLSDNTNVLYTNPISLNTYGSNGGANTIEGINVTNNSWSGTKYFGSLGTFINNPNPSLVLGLYQVNAPQDRATPCPYKETKQQTAVGNNPFRWSLDFGCNSVNGSIAFGRNTTWNSGYGFEMDFYHGNNSPVLDHRITSSGIGYFTIFQAADGLTADNGRNCVSVFNATCPFGGNLAVGYSQGNPFTVNLLGQFAAQGGSTYGAFQVNAAATAAAPTAVATNPTTGSVTYALTAVDNGNGASAVGTPITVTTNTALSSTNPVSLTPNQTVGGSTYDVSRTANTLGLANGYIGTITPASAANSTAATTGYAFANIGFDTGQAPTTVPSHAPTGMVNAQGGFAILNQLGSKSIQFTPDNPSFATSVHVGIPAVAGELNFTSENLISPASGSVGLSNSQSLNTLVLTGNVTLSLSAPSVVSAQNNTLSICQTGSNTFTATLPATIAGIGGTVVTPNGGTCSNYDLEYSANIPGYIVTGTNVIPSGSGTITAVTAGAGLTGGGSSGSVSLSLATALPSGETATTQTAGDNSTKVATDAFVLANATSSAATSFQIFAGPSSDQALTAAYTAGVTTMTVGSTAGYFVPTSSIPMGYIAVGYAVGAFNACSYTGLTSTQFTGLTCGLFNIASTNQSIGNTVQEIKAFSANTTSGAADVIALWNGNTLHSCSTGFNGFSYQSYSAGASDVFCNATAKGTVITGPLTFAGGIASMPLQMNAGNTGLTTPGNLTVQAAGAASSSGVLISGAPYTGGTGTTNFPQLYVNSGTAPTSFSTAGTMFGVNAPSGFVGHLAEFLTNGASVANVSYTGLITAQGLNSGASIAIIGTTPVFKINGDTGFSRDSTLGAGYWDIGNGTSNDTTGKVRAAAFMSMGTTFTASASGCTLGSLTGGASAGSFPVSAGGTCTVTVTMGNTATAPHGWTCWANDVTSHTSWSETTGGSTTTDVLYGAAATSDVVKFGCMAY